jgi:hypothetical protein
MEIQPLKLPTQNMPSASLSCLVVLLAKIEVLELRLAEMAAGNEPMSPKISDDLTKKFFEEWEVTVLAKFGK